MNSIMINENSFQETIDALNRLQSSVSSLKNSSKLHRSDGSRLKFAKTLIYLDRCGINLDEFESRIPAIHVAGTKGKGSTCALCESILRAHGYRTGLFTSPHLINVRERIRIDGNPLSCGKFTKYFWDVHNRLNNNKEHEDDMPMYFQFLTVMAFYVFWVEKIDVAVIEVGIGGELDCTNIIRRPPVVGITSLGLDHTKILGDTIEEIAWEKAGIIKPGCLAFTVPNHKPKALKVLRDRAEEKKVLLQVVPDIDEYNFDNSDLPLAARLNSSTAIQLAHTWMKWRNGSCKDSVAHMTTEINEKTWNAIKNCDWNGRFQIVKRGKHTFFLDGAHTRESTEVCAKWFDSSAPRNQRLLMFNTTHGRNAEVLLKPFVDCNISKAIFCTNDLSTSENKIPLDIFNKKASAFEASDVSSNNMKTWKLLQGVEANNCRTIDSVEDAVAHIDSINEPSNVLVTGSLHLVGVVLTVFSNSPI